MRCRCAPRPLASRRLKPFLHVLTLGGVGLLMVVGLAGAAGARVNGTRSIPLGLYWTTHDPVTRGAYVTFCPPATEIFAEARRRGYLTVGPCPGRFGLVMKRVAGQGGDAVQLSPAGVEVNGVVLPLSTRRSADSRGRPLPCEARRQYILAPDELLLMSDVSETSFDGRYFGPIPAQHVQNVVVPIWTW